MIGFNTFYFLYGWKYVQFLWLKFQIIRRLSVVLAFSDFPKDKFRFRIIFGTHNLIYGVKKKEDESVLVLVISKSTLSKHIL